MKRAGSFLGPVGLFFVSLGYTAAVGIARLFVTLESVCTQHCPVIRVQGFRFHHMYYGVLLLLVSLGVMIRLRRQSEMGQRSRCRYRTGTYRGRNRITDPETILLEYHIREYFRGGRAP